MGGSISIFILLLLLPLTSNLFHDLAVFICFFFDKIFPAFAIIFVSLSSSDGLYILHFFNPLHISGLIISFSLNCLSKCFIIISSIDGDCSINLSNSARHIFKKSPAGFLLFSSNANSTVIFLLNLDQDTLDDLCPSINSAYLKKFCNVDIIPAKILNPPTIPIAIFFCS